LVEKVKKLVDKPKFAGGIMKEVTIKNLLEAGVHFGHQTRRWNPKMKKYIFCERNGIYIIDLKISLDKLKEAYNAAKAIVENGGSVLFVGTKKQAKDIIEEEAKRCGSNYVSERWLGGMLTNFRTIRRSIDRIREIERMAEDGSYEHLTKKEILMLEREKEKLLKILSGIRTMEKIPSALFVVDIKKESLAIAEAKKLRIPIIAMVDTNVDPDMIDFPIPSNDDAIRAIKLIAEHIADAVLEGKERSLEGADAENTADEVEVMEESE